MNKRTVLLLSTLAATTVAASTAVCAYASDGPSPVAPTAPVEQARPDGKPDNRGQRVRERLQHQREKFQERCGKAAKAEQAPGLRKQCRRAAAMFLRRLVKLHERLENRQERLSAAIEKHCGSAAATPSAGEGAEKKAERCARAKRRLERLEKLGSRLETLIERIKIRLASTDADAPTVSEDESDLVE